MRKAMATMLLSIWGYLFIGYLSLEPTNRYLENACFKKISGYQSIAHIAVWPISYWAAATTRSKC